jgi:toxin-antitoxin system PIN domain toxin
VILVDVNILLHAANAQSDHHVSAKSWLDRMLQAPAPLGLPWHSILGFLRLATNTRVFPRPLAMAVAWEQIRTWLAAEAAWIPHPTEHHADVLEELLRQPGVHGNLVPDAHLAALAIEHGLILCSADGDFARFSGLRWQNPLAE